jgi:hypothetical protein
MARRIRFSSQVTTTQALTCGWAVAPDHPPGLPPVAGMADCVPQVSGHCCYGDDVVRRLPGYEIYFILYRFMRLPTVFLFFCRPFLVHCPWSYRRCSRRSYNRLLHHSEVKSTLSARCRPEIHSMYYLITAILSLPCYYSYTTTRCKCCVFFFRKVEASRELKAIKLWNVQSEHLLAVADKARKVGT